MGLSHLVVVGVKLRPESILNVLLVSDESFCAVQLWRPIFSTRCRGGSCQIRWDRVP
jgi:hypothetical protein